MFKRLLLLALAAAALGVNLYGEDQEVAEEVSQQVDQDVPPKAVVTEDTDTPMADMVAEGVEE